MGEHIVVFANPDEVEAWYECPGTYRPGSAEDLPSRLTYVPGSACGFRASWDDPAWVADQHGDKGCPCGAEPPLMPVGCNWQVICDPSCEHNGCDLSDCVMGARDDRQCPFGCNAVVREVKAEAVDGDRQAVVLERSLRAA